MRFRAAFPLVLVSFLGLGCRSPQTGTGPWTTLPTGLGIMDLVQGQGPSPRLGQTCVVDALGWIEEGGVKGRAFLDTRKRGYPSRFPMGGGRVIKGWEDGLATMQKGGKRLLRVPPALGYSPQELGQDIPPGSTLIFELELLDIR